jgi:hypothetical protein
VVFRAVADGEARVKEQPFQAELALCQHRHGAFRHFLRRLSRHHEMKFPFPRVIPGIGVVRFQRRDIA